ncbi:EscU/YscU/HrcU family type III secretion system export apparatus switch protein [Fervidibacillus halotolerans]|uniref:EscU/YscU/HrcU family type III secretion system export apparatus switch protein n=1 Tax=Fervidibacillus halotolerans TaxID=2980027 RepID=A0A9E8M2X9_9BACI|nr:EscU/YscU/HrcU family type III secretion system export apparatus switch protein [Fervidibacillus halotolerans]WAA13616.1 EscU/YscU/HrcU family type III secretion system export apparatus switch protein [Fervidibacillus halotolerans]
MKKNEKKEAIALTYDEKKDTAPVVKAKGKGFVAEKIIEEAKKHRIPIYEDASLVELLDKVNIEEKIPEELFMAVAEVFAFIYNVDQKASKT